MFRTMILTFLLSGCQQNPYAGLGGEVSADDYVSLYHDWFCVNAEGCFPETYASSDDCVDGQMRQWDMFHSGYDFCVDAISASACVEQMNETSREDCSVELPDCTPDTLAFECE